MKYTRRLKVPAHHDHSPSLHQIERHLRRRDLLTRRNGDQVEAKLFAWKEFFSETDADRFSWNSLAVTQEDSTLRLHLKYNWQLQAFAQIVMSAFTASLLFRVGNPAATLPILAVMNAVFIGVSFLWALSYAKKLASEIEAVTLETSRAA